MAKHTEITYTSDLSGDRGAETVPVRLAFDIDLTPKERDKLFALLAPYMDGGRKPETAGHPATDASKAPNAPTRKTVVDREQSKQMRAWLQKNGYNLSDRGRVPLWMVERYEIRRPAWQGDSTSTPASTVSDAPAEVAVEVAKVEAPEVAAVPETATKPARKAAVARKAAPVKTTKTNGSNGTTANRAVRKAVPALEFAGSART